MASAVFKNGSGDGKAPRLRFGRGLLIGGLAGALSIFIALLALSYAYPASQKLHNAPAPAEWAQKMEHLGVCLIYYAVRHDGKLPEKLSALYKEGYVKELSQFDSSEMPGKAASEADIDAGADFIYLLPGGTISAEPQAALRQNLPGGRTLFIAKKGLSWDSSTSTPSAH